MRYLSVKNSQCGLTLIEIMIAMLIGLFLIGGVLQIFISTKQTYRMQENLSRMQENGRFAMEFLGRDIRMAGYWVCMTPAGGDITGTNDNATSGDSIDDGTDTITFRADFAQLSSGACGDSVNTVAAYYTDPRSIIAYTIDGSVLRKRTNNQINDLIEGVENMQLSYGIDTDSDGTPNYYVSAPALTDPAWNQVVSIRVSLLIRSMDNNLATQSLPYSFNGSIFTPAAGDFRIRKIFTSTIAVRNRLR